MRNAGCSDNAKGQLVVSIRRAEAGEEVILTRHGLAVARLVAFKALVAPEAGRNPLQRSACSALRYSLLDGRSRGCNSFGAARG